MARFFNSYMQYNTIWIVESLGQKESHTGKELARNLKPVCETNEIALAYRHVTNSKEFKSVLEEIGEAVRSGSRQMYPVLHLEIHGSSNHDGLVLVPSRELFTWQDLADCCRKINEGCKNNLLLVMAVCFGMESILDVSIKNLTPYFALIGSEEKIYHPDIVKFTDFYAKLILENDLEKAQNCLTNKYGIYHCERIFFKAYAYYVLSGTKGKGKRQRVENLLTQVMQTNVRNEIPIREVRNYIKNEIEPTTEQFDKYMEIFLMANHPENQDRFKFDLQDVLDFTA